MSLYENTKSATAFNVISNASGRPIWLNIALIIALIYTFFGMVSSVIAYQESNSQHQEHVNTMKKTNEPFRTLNPELFAKLNKISEEGEANVQKIQNKILIRSVISGIVVVASIIYIVKSIQIIGWLIGAMWAIKLLAIFLGMLQIDIVIWKYLPSLRTFGTEAWLHYVQAITLNTMMMGVYFYSAFKFKRPIN